MTNLLMATISTLIGIILLKLGMPVLAGINFGAAITNVIIVIAILYISHNLQW